jgi:predicted amidohydrolase
MKPDMTRQAPAWLGGVTAGLAIVGGVGYIIDCRVAGEELDSCWMTGHSMIARASDLALGAAAGGVVGYWTKNPALHRREREDGPPPGARRLPTDPDA